MLPRQNRLRQGRDIDRVYKHGRYGGGGNLSVKARPNGYVQSRAVVVVGKKIDKRAVVRNRIRRRLASLLSQKWGTVAPGYDIVVSVHQDISAAQSGQLERELQRGLEQAGTLMRK